MRPGKAALLLLSLAALAQTDSIRTAVEALQRGDTAEAERLARGELRTHPADPDALAVLGYVLDQQAKYAEADPIYRRVLAANARSPMVWNNYGNHLLAMGRLDTARTAFTKALALNPAQTNAKLQLARIAVTERKPSEAMSYLGRLTGVEQQNPLVPLLRMQALYELHRDSEGDAVLKEIDTPGHETEVGAALAAAGEYRKAEDLLARAAAAHPEDFEAQHRLGIAASKAGDHARAAEALSAAHKLKPEDAETAYDLAVGLDRTGKSLDALEVLAQASKTAPENADILILLARTTADLGYYGDAIAVWDRLLKLKPGDAIARRERAWNQTALGENMAASVAELQAFVRQHPRDATGHFELGTAELVSGDERPGAAELDRALQLDPKLTAAHVARGVLRYHHGDPEAALPDFEAAAQLQPNNVTVLDRLGETYLALDRAQDALPLLRKAAELAPSNSRVLLHLGRALGKAGQVEEAALLMARFRELGPDRSALPHPAGLMDFLSLPEQEREARYRAGVERTVSKNPANAEAQVRYLQILLAEGKTDAAAGVAQKILDLKPSATLLSEAAESLIGADQWQLARSFTEKAIAAAGPIPSLEFDLQTVQKH